MENDTSVDLIELSDEELDAVLLLSKEGSISDAPFWDEPYTYLYRQGLVERFYSDEFPAPPICELSIPRNAIRLTDKGRLFVARHEQEQKKLREKAAENKASKQDERKFQIALSLISAVVGSLITLFVEHFAQILEFVSSVLQ